MGMRHKTILFLLISLTIGIAPPITMYYLSNLNNNQKNGFERTFITKTSTTPSSIIDLKYSGYYISGYTDHNLFLSHPKILGHNVMAHTQTLDTSHINITFEKPKKIPQKMKWNRTKVSIDSPNVYMADGFSGNILKTSLFDKNVEMKTFENVNFSQYVPFTDSLSNTIFKAYNFDLKQNILIKNTKNTAVSPKYILKRQVDGVFCTDGKLLYTKGKSKKLIHVYNYRNQIICLDTMLKEIYTSKTIDTISFANIEVADIKSNTQRTLSKKPLVVNKESCIYKDYFFVHSGVKADNEEYITFKTNSTIDVYNSNNGTYLSSFYIPRHKKKELSDFQIIGETLYALYNSHLIAYPIKHFF